MKITNVKIPENYFDNGLKEINMDRLGDIVVLAGKNGAGKTRLANTIYNAVNSYILTTKTLSMYEQLLSNTMHPRLRKQHKNTLSELKHPLECDSFFIADKRYDKYVAVKFVPNDLNFIDPRSSSSNEISQAHTSAKDLQRISEMNKHILLYIEKESNQYFTATHPNTKDKSKKAEFEKSFKALDDLIEQFLGVRLDRDDGGCTLFGMPIGAAQLSDGQNVLLQLCVVLHAQNASLDNLVLILDEPENHLHPQAQVEFINSVKNALTDGQMWVSTHSVHILSQLPMNSIYYMEDGGISYAGKTPENVLNSLLGGKENIETLNAFLSYPSVYACNQFVSECLFPPLIATAKTKDKQTAQITDIIEKIKKDKGGKISVLDYGAGQGRLLSTIAENYSDNSLPIKDWLNYVAYDISTVSEDCRGRCMQEIEKVYGNSKDRYVNELDINDLINNKEFDIAVICNVLHEVSPKKWVDEFKKLCVKLSDTGFLLLVEDTQLPFGEKPNEDGFFILGRAELMKLFSMKAEDFVTEPHKENERLMAHLINKKHIENISKETQQKALEELKNRCETWIGVLRGKTDSSSGRLLAFYLQQYANVSLYLK
ncbi:MAG: AAA family ATPase [Firmicutes bacterium]|nr:AAA family ATPase [Bacillota bacterium]